ncbi:uncharacterized protein TNCV_3925691 [Trichonephila clavipes]|nr:uncharacterized protein TNCV_3925691 [Trichonephila clavipes]
MNEDRCCKKIFLENPMRNRPQGRPPLRWIDCVEKYLLKAKSALQDKSAVLCLCPNTLESISTDHWGTHIAETSEKGLKRPKLLKGLTATKWGSTQDVLSTVYKTYARPVLDHGCEVATLNRGLIGRGEKNVNYDGEILAVCEVTTQLLAAGLAHAKVVFFIDSQTAILALSSNTPTDCLNTIQCRTKIVELISYGWTVVGGSQIMLGSPAMKEVTKKPSRLNQKSS